MKWLVLVRDGFDGRKAVAIPLHKVTDIQVFRKNGEYLMRVFVGENTSYETPVKNVEVQEFKGGELLPYLVGRLSFVELDEVTEK